MLTFPVMRRLLLSATLLLAVPFSVLALDYSDSSALYKDAPFNLAERAAISVLTNLKAVEGYPDGTFKPNQKLNRAEFLKIVLLSNPNVRSSQSDAEACFPDVKKEDWFSQFVCLSKKRGIVGGYPDGNFKPAQYVNYAEALKILVELYEFNTESQPGEEWYLQYVRLADTRDTLLPIDIPFDTLLTRGQMARLAAAFRADHEGELKLYHLAEKSISQALEEQASTASGSTSSGSSSSSTSTGSSASSRSSSFSSSSSSSQATLFPAKSAFLMLGSTPIDIIADATFTARDVNAEVRSVRIDMTREVESFEEMYLIDSKGNTLVTLRLDPYNTDDDKKKWIGTLEEDVLTLSSTGITLGLTAKLYSRDSARSTPEELIKVNDFLLSVQPTIGDEYLVYGENPHYPQHQVVQAELNEVVNLRSSGLLENGTKRLLGEFRFSANALTGSVPAVEHLTFNVEALNVSVTNWRVGNGTSATTTSCALDGVNVISCFNIVQQLGAIDANGTEIQIFGDVTLTDSNASLQVNLNSPGAIGADGAVRWTDGVGHYTWIRKSTPVAKGMLLQN